MGIPYKVYCKGCFLLHLKSCSEKCFLFQYWTKLWQLYKAFKVTRVLQTGNSWSDGFLHAYSYRLNVYILVYSVLTKWSTLGRQDLNFRFQYKLLSKLNSKFFFSKLEQLTDLFKCNLQWNIVTYYA